jgi:outer membrane lipoprotein-sorting protein
VRLMSRATLCLFFLLGGVLAHERFASAGQPQAAPGETNVAKGWRVTKQVIAALGGSTYLNVHNVQCDGREAAFGTSGTLMGFTLFRDMWLFPDKNRVEYFTKGEHTIVGFLMGSDELLVTHGGAMITVYDGKEGWTLDKAGVSNQPEDLIKTFNDRLKTDMNTVLRKRINEPGVEAEYAGPDIIDLKEAEWIEFTDREHRLMRLGIDKYSHLPLRWVVVTRNPETRVKSEVITSYTQYTLNDGIKTPLSIEQSHDDRKVSQTFLSSCKYNTDISPDLFTRSALEQAAKDTGKKGLKEPKN